MLVHRMRRLLRKRYLAVGLFTGLLALVVGSMIASQILGASAAPISHTGRVRASKATGQASWLYMPSGFAGKVLHWSEKGSFFEAGIADPSNGKVLLGDHWMALDAHGQPTAYHVRYTYPDGQLHQEIYENATASILVEGSDYLRPHQLVPPGWCVTPMQINFSALMGQYPLFADATKLGHSMTNSGMQSLTLTPPATSSLPGVTPTAREDNVATVDVWISTQIDPVDRSKAARQLSLGPLGRVVAQTTTVTRDGSIGLSAWSVYGPLDVYDSSSVPPTIFKAPQDIGKECV